MNLPQQGAQPIAGAHHSHLQCRDTNAGDLRHLIVPQILHVLQQESLSLVRVPLTKSPLDLLPPHRLLGRMLLGRPHERGFVMDETLVSGIQPGVDNRDSVTDTLGRPTFVGQFTERDWYYVSVDTRQLAFSSPNPVRETVLHVRFDDRGNVQSVERTGMEKIASISPMTEKTPTLGRNRSFFQELFSNVGTVNAGGGAANPNQ